MPGLGKNSTSNWTLHRKGCFGELANSFVIAVNLSLQLLLYGSRLSTQEKPKFQLNIKGYVETPHEYVHRRKSTITNESIRSLPNTWFSQLR